MNIETSIVNGKTWYHFTNRGTRYDVTRDGEFFEVWSARGVRPGQVQLLTAGEMASRSRALGALVETLNADEVAH